MVALRKDVKVGLTIGAIAVLVIGVYAGLSALAGDKPANGQGNGQGATLAVSPMDGTRTATGGASVAGKTNGPTPEPIRISPLGGNNTATNTAGTTPPQVQPPTQANPADGLAATPAGKDPWEVAFRDGTLQPKKTVTPTPGKQETVADQQETIRSLTADPARNDARPTPTNVADGSGNLSGTPATPELTRSPETTPPATPTTPAMPAGPTKTHTVEAGDTLSSISTAFYGDPNQFNAIIAANPQVNPNRLKIGTVLNIPDVKTTPKSDTAEQPAVGAAGKAIDASTQYVVKPGDSLQKIARVLWNDSAKANQLYELNKSVIGADATKIKPGMVLTLPAAPSEKTGG